MIDLHCHLLVGIDDGPQKLEDATRMAQVAAEDGTRTVIATPHVSPEFPATTAEVIETHVGRLRAALRTHDVDLTVLAGAEIALARAGELRDAQLLAMGLGGGPRLLVELPWRSSAGGVINALHALAGRGFRILLAHPERTPMLRDDLALVRRLVDDGAHCCLTANSLSPAAGRATQTAARRLLKNGLVHAIASDAHDLGARPPRLRGALVDAGLSSGQIEYFTEHAPRAILDGEEPGAPPHVDLSRRPRWVRRLLV